MRRKDRKDQLRTINELDIRMNPILKLQHYKIFIHVIYKKSVKTGKKINSQQKKKQVRKL